MTIPLGATGMPVLLLAFAAAVGGFLCLAFSMLRHYRAIFRRPAHASVRMLARGAGWLMLLVSLGLCVVDLDWSVGPVVWAGVLSIAGVVVAGLVTFATRAQR
jgi:vacuolar-type H+-ATPase subunit I/STV1